MLKERLGLDQRYILEDNLILIEDELYGDSYRFKQPIPHPYLPFYFVIPTMPDLAITLGGHLTNIKTGRSLRFTKSAPVPDKRITGGYMINRKGSRHRMMCLAFREYTMHPQRLWVNHRNGIPGDDDITNLEWVTPSENIKHAYDSGLHSKKARQVYVRHLDGDEIHFFETVLLASEFTGVSGTAIFSRLLRSNGNLYPDGWRFSEVDEWEPLDARMRIASNEKMVQVLKVESGVVEIYDNCQIASISENVAAGTIIAHARRGSSTPILGKIFRYMDGEFPTFDKEQLRLFEYQEWPFEPIPGVIVTSNDGEEFFGTLPEVAARYGYSESGIRGLIRRDELPNGLSFKLITCRGK